jgi:CelD/BcsL family acetyltransferase involved in cellulose biosynthesis
MGVAEKLEVGHIVSNNFNDFFKSRTHKFRRNITEYTNQLNRLGTLNFRFESVSVGNDLNEIIELHKLKWNPTITPSRFNDQNEINFFNDFFLKSNENLHASVSVLKLNDVTLAMLGWLVSGNYTHPYIAVFNQDYYKYSTGNVMWKFFIENCITKKFEVSFGRGLSEYKKRWANTISYIITYVSYDGSKAKIVGSINKLKNRMKKILQKMHIYPVVKKIKDSIIKH